MACGPRRVGPSRVCGIKLSWSPATAHDDVLLALASCLQQRRKKLQQGQDRAHWRKRLPGALWKTGLLTEALDRQGATGHRGGSIEQANQKKARHGRDSERVQSLRADGEGLSPGASRGAGQQSQWPTGLQPEGTAAASFWNRFQKHTDLNVSPGVHQTAPGTSPQLCVTGWSRVPGGRRTSGRRRDSALWERDGQRTGSSVGLDARPPHPQPGLPRSTVQTPSPSRTLPTHPQTLVNRASF